MKGIFQVKNWQLVLVGLLGGTSAWGAPHLNREHADTVVLAPLDSDANFAIDDVTLAGTGCPAGSVEHHTSGSMLYLTFDDFAVHSGHGTPLPQRRKFCQGIVEASIAPGWSYALARVSMGGRAQLDDGVTATLRTTIYFQGSDESAEMTHRLVGERRGTFRVSDEWSDSDLVWSPCEAVRALNLKIAVMVGAPSGATGEVTLSRAQAYGIKVRRC